MALRPVTPADADAIYAIASDPQVARYMDWPVPKDASEVRRRLESTAGPWAELEEHTWILAEVRSARIVGRISARSDGDGVKFGYFVGRRFWGSGMAFDGAALLVEWLRGQSDVRRVWASVDVENARSRRLLERLGLRHEQTLERATVRPNLGDEPRDTAIYAWSRSDGETPA